MSFERKARLDALGFVWDPFTAQWEEGFQHLQAFMKEHGHCRVTSTHVTADGYRLGAWVSVQRAKKDRLASERKARLDALGFVWPHEVTSDSMLKMESAVEAGGEPTGGKHPGIRLRDS